MDAYSKPSGTKNLSVLVYSTDITVNTFAQTSISRSGISTPRQVIQTLTPSKNGYRNPQWRHQVAHLQNATTPFSGRDYTVAAPWIRVIYEVKDTRPSDGLFVYDYHSFEQQGASLLTCPVVPVVDTTTITEVTNHCIAKFLDAYHQIQSSFEAGQDLGEWRETLHGIHRPLNTLRQSVLSYLSRLEKVKRAVKKPASLRKILSDTYLEYHFGWKPLAEDVASAIADAGRHRFPAYPISVSSTKTFSGKTVTSTLGPVSAFFSNALTHSYVETSTYKVRYKGVVRVRNLASDGRISAFQAYQFTPDRWLPTAWDLIPYSWIVDYFINIGEMIDALSTCFSVDFCWSCKTARAETRRKYSDVVLSPFSPPSPALKRQIFQFSATGGACEVSSRSIDRSAIDWSDLVPRLEFKIPAKSPYPFLNIAALISQRVKRLVPFF